MSRFNDISRGLAVAIHKATKKYDDLLQERTGTVDDVVDNVMNDKDVREAVKELVEHTIKMTKDK